MALSATERLTEMFDKNRKIRALSNLVSAERGRFNLPIDDWREEARLLHKQRTVKNLNPSSATFARQLANAVVNETAVRSRLTEMLAQTTNVSRLLKDYLSAVEGYLITNYASELSSVLKTVKDRERFVEVYMREYWKLLAGMENFLAELQFYVTDIDKAGYGTRVISDVFIAVFKAEGRVDL